MPAWRPITSAAAGARAPSCRRRARPPACRATRALALPAVAARCRKRGSGGVAALAKRTSGSSSSSSSAPSRRLYHTTREVRQPLTHPVDQLGIVQDRVAYSRPQTARGGERSSAGETARVTASLVRVRVQVHDGCCHGGPRVESEARAPRVQQRRPSRSAGGKPRMGRGRVGAHAAQS